MESNKRVSKLLTIVQKQVFPVKRSIQAFMQESESGSYQTKLKKRVPRLRKLLKHLEGGAFVDFFLICKHVN